MVIVINGYNHRDFSGCNGYNQPLLIGYNYNGLTLLQW